MHYLIILALIYPLISTALDAQSRESMSGRQAMVTNATTARLDSLRWFAIAANQYVASTPFASTVTATVTWDTMKISSGVPDAMKGLSVPSTWVLRGNSTQWAICVSADDRILVMSMTGQEIALQDKGGKSTMPNVKFGVSGTAGVIGFLGEQINGANQNVC